MRLVSFCRSNDRSAVKPRSSQIVRPCSEGAVAVDQQVVCRAEQPRPGIADEQRGSTRTSAVMPVGSRDTISLSVAPGAAARERSCVSLLTDQFGRIYPTIENEISLILCPLFTRRMSSTRSNTFRRLRDAGHHPA